MCDGVCCCCCCCCLLHNTFSCFSFLLKSECCTRDHTDESKKKKSNNICNNRAVIKKRHLSDFEGTPVHVYYCFLALLAGSFEGAIRFRGGNRRLPADSGGKEESVLVGRAGEEHNAEARPVFQPPPPPCRQTAPLTIQLPVASATCVSINLSAA